jgi:hypothetical protein
MLNLDKIIFQRRKIVVRQQHLCYVCNQVIQSKTSCIFEKIANLARKRFESRRRHENCPDLNDLVFIKDDPNRNDTLKKIKEMSQYAGSSKEHSS